MKIGLRWIKKYIPKKLDNILIYKNEIEVMKEWFQTFEFNKVLCIYGKIGCGKTTIIKLLLEYYDYNYTIIDPLNINYRGSLEKIIEQSLNYNNVYNMYCEKDKNELIFDDIGQLIKTNNKNFLPIL